MKYLKGLLIIASTVYFVIGTYMIWYFGFKQVFSKQGHIDIFLPRIAAVAVTKALLWPYFVFRKADSGDPVTHPNKQQGNLHAVLEALGTAKDLLEEADRMVVVAGGLDKLTPRELLVYKAKIEVAATTLRQLEYSSIERIDGPLAFHLKTFLLPGLLRMHEGIKSGNLQEYNDGIDHVTKYFEWHNHNAQRLKSIFENIR